LKTCKLFIFCIRHLCTLLRQILLFDRIIFYIHNTQRINGGSSMKKSILYISLLSVVFLSVSCATVPEDRYNTQKGAAIGAGIGALLGQAIGGDTEATLLGAGIGTVVGAVAGNAVDQDHQAARDAAMLNKRVVYVDGHGRAVEAIPVESSQQTNCRKVTKRHWDNGQLISETIEEICEGEKTSKDY
jgi:outer membrane lipoprotein SlyB